LRTPSGKPGATPATFDSFTILQLLFQTRFNPKFVSRKIGGSSPKWARVSRSTTKANWACTGRRRSARRADSIIEGIAGVNFYVAAQRNRDGQRQKFSRMFLPKKYAVQSNADEMGFSGRLVRGIHSVIHRNCGYLLPPRNYFRQRLSKPRLQEQKRWTGNRMRDAHDFIRLGAAGVGIYEEAAASGCFVLKKRGG
ncbi:MAG: hypothetical protein NTW47_06085, partial [Proteobacteria bacterium]|nr:hypothetical protein [Pseudomonadota bacterium]